MSVSLERKSTDVLMVTKNDWYPSSDVQVIVSSCQLNASVRFISTLFGTGRVKSNCGVVQTSVPVETFPCSQILHLVSCGSSAYSP